MKIYKHEQNMYTFDYCVYEISRPAREPHNPNIMEQIQINLSKDFLAQYLRSMAQFNYEGICSTNVTSAILLGSD